MVQSSLVLLASLRRKGFLDFPPVYINPIKSNMLFFLSLIICCLFVLACSACVTDQFRSCSRRTFPPPCVYCGCPDNEIRLQLPPSLRSSLTYLSCTDAPCPGGGILNRVPLHKPTGALICDPNWQQVQNSI